MDIVVSHQGTKSRQSGWGLSGWEFAQKGPALPPALTLLAVLGFLVMVAYIPGLLNVSQPGRWALITVVGLPALLTSFDRFDPRLPEVWVGLALLVWVGLSWYWSISPWDTLGGELHWLALAGIFLLARRVESLSVFWAATAIGLAVSLPFMVLQIAGYQPVWSVAAAGFPGIAGLFHSTNVLAEVAACVFLGLVFSGYRWLALPIGFMALASGRKEALLMLAVAGLAWAWSQRHRWQHNWMLPTALVVAGAVALNFRLAHEPLGNFTASVAERLNIWLVTLFTATPLGWGLGTFGYVFPNYGFAHNDLLQLVFELGVGSFLVFWLIGHALRHADVPDRAILLALLVTASIWAPLEDPATALLVAVVVGHVYGTRARAFQPQPDDGAEYVDHAAPAGFVPTAALREAA